MEKMNINGTEVVLKRESNSFTYGDMAKWALNKARGKIIRSEYWGWMLQTDYDNLNRLVVKRRHRYVAVADVLPVNIKAEYLGGGYNFKAYEIEVESTWYNRSTSHKAILVVPYNKKAKMLPPN